MKRISFIKIVTISTFIAFPLVFPEQTMAQSNMPCGLGSSWKVVAGCWPGIYTRRGSSNIFDAEMKQVNGDRYTATVVVSINGNQVTATQTDTGGGKCYLRNGLLDSDGRTITGTYECHPIGGSVQHGCFIAFIECDGIAEASMNLIGTWTRKHRVKHTYTFDRGGGATLRTGPPLNETYRGRWVELRPGTFKITWPHRPSAGYDTKGNFVDTVTVTGNKLSGSNNYGDNVDLYRIQ